MVEMEDFAGADTISVVKYGVMKRALFAGLGWLALSLPLAAQEPFDSAATFVFYRPELLTAVDSSSLLADLPMWTLLDGRLPGTSSLGRMGMETVALSADGSSHSETSYTVAELQRIVVHANGRKNSGKDAKDSKDLSAESLAVEKDPLVWTGGEVGFIYGHSSGKFGGDEFSSYIMGGVGNEHMQINVGASYEESNFRLPRRFR